MHIKNPDHMTKMATMPICDKNFSVDSQMSDCCPFGYLFYKVSTRNLTLYEY